MATPLDQPNTGATDGSGNCTVQSPVRAAYWSLVWATVGGFGQPSWILGVNGNNRLFGSGADDVMGPVMVPPNSQATVYCIGATARSQVTVSFWGWQSDGTDNGADLAPMMGSVASALSLSGATVPVTIPGTISTNANVINPSLTIGGNVGVQNVSGTELATILQITSAGSFDVNPGAGVTQDYTFPAGAAGIAIIVTAAVADYLSTLTAGDVQSGDNSLDETPTIPGGATYIDEVIGSPGDTIQVHAAANPTNASPVTVGTYFVPPGVINRSEIVNTPGNPVVVSLADTPPAAYQAPQLWAVGSAPPTGSTVIAAPSSPDFLRIFNINSYIFAGTGFFNVQDSVSGKTIFGLNTTGQPAVTENLQGLPLPVGHGLVTNSGTGVSGAYVIGYSVTSN